MAPPPQLPLDSEELKQSKQVAVYYRWMDINNTPQTGKTTFSVEANGTTQSDIEKNLHTTISDTLANIEETIVYDIVNPIVVNINSTYLKDYPQYQLIVEKQDSKIVIGYPVLHTTYYDWYTINFPIQFPIQFPIERLPLPVIIQELSLYFSTIMINFPEISKIVIN